MTSFVAHEKCHGEVAPGIGHDPPMSGRTGAARAAFFMEAEGIDHQGTGRELKTPASDQGKFKGNGFFPLARNLRKSLKIKRAAGRN
jgi:hypothetical protein